MDDQYAPHIGMLACMPCRIAVRWWRGTGDPERQPLFPNPATILTPPRRRPNLPNLSSTSSLTRQGEIWSSAPVSPAKSTGLRPDLERVGAGKLSNEGRERIGSISRAYGGRMQSLQPPPSISSTPSIPSTPTGGTVIRTLSALRPEAHSSTSALPGPSRHKGAAAPHPSATVPPPVPYRPSVPNLGRSVSEPRNLAELGEADFAPHQIPSYEIFVGRGRGRGRSARGRRERSATVSALSGLGIGRGLSASALPHDGEGRGRSPGPAVLGSLAQTQGTEGAPDQPGETEVAQGSEKTLGRSMSHPTLNLTDTLDTQAEGGDGSSLISQSRSGVQVEGANEDEDEGVIKRDLGLRELRTLGSARVRGKKARGTKSLRSRGVKRIISD